MTFVGLPRKDLPIGSIGLHSTGWWAMVCGIITEADLARSLDENQLAEFVEKVYTTA